MSCKMYTFAESIAFPMDGEADLDLSSDSSSSEMQDSESDGFDDVSDSGLNVSKEEVQRNLALLGVPVEPDPSTLLLSELRLKHPRAFSPESESLLSTVLAETLLPFPALSDFQVGSFFSVSLLLIKQLCCKSIQTRCSASTPS